VKCRGEEGVVFMGVALSRIACRALPVATTSVAGSWTAAEHPLILRSWVSPPADGSRSPERSHTGDAVRNRHHAGCRVAGERAADRYTLICDGPRNRQRLGRRPGRQPTHVMAYNLPILRIFDGEGRSEHPSHECRSVRSSGSRAI
jgi:hypothetical protein